MCIRDRRTAVVGRTREIPEGVTDLESLYLLWDVELPRREPVSYTHLTLPTSDLV